MTASPAYFNSGAYSTTGPSSTATSIDATYPTGVLANDIAVLVVHIAGTTTVTGYPSSFTQITSNGVGGGYASRMNIAWKRCTGVESSTTVTTTVAAAAPLRAVLHIFRGCLLVGTPYEGLAGTYTSSTSTSTAITWPAFTTSVANTLGLHIGMRIIDSVISPTVTAGASWTKRFDTYSNNSATPTATNECILETKSIAGTGSESTITSTSANAMGYNSVSLALLPDTTITSNSLFFGSMF